MNNFFLVSFYTNYVKGKLKNRYWTTKLFSKCVHYENAEQVLTIFIHILRAYLKTKILYQYLRAPHMVFFSVKVWFNFNYEHLYIVTIKMLAM